MAGYQAFWADIGWWWIFPIVMIVLCVFMMRGRMGCMMCWPSSRSSTKTGQSSTSDSAGEILDKRYALGEINREEYEEKKGDIEQTNGKGLST
jgi:putative membrane protein